MSSLLWPSSASSTMSLSSTTMSYLSQSSSKFINCSWWRFHLGSFGMKLTHHNPHQNHYHHHHNHHHHSLSTPNWCRLCFKSFWMISPSPCSRLIIFQHKLYFQFRRLAYYKSYISDICTLPRHISSSSWPGKSWINALFGITQFVTPNTHVLRHPGV